MLGNMIPPIYAPNGSGGGGSAPVTNTTTTAFTGGAWTFTKDAEVGAVENVVTFTVSDDTGAFLRVRNGSITDSKFTPQLFGYDDGTDEGLKITTDSATDAGTLPSLAIETYIANGVGTTRPALTFSHQAATLLSVSGVGTWTFTKPAEASTAEVIATFKVSDDASSKFEVMSGSTTDGQFVPMLRATSPSTAIGWIQRASGTTDSGTSALLFWDTRIGASTAVVTRPLYTWANAGAAILSLLPLNSGANSALSWGTQSGAVPAFTTRPAGLRLVLYSAISGSKVDNSIGVTASGAANWYAVQEATSSYSHDFYAGTTKVAVIRGDGLIDNTGTIRATGQTAPSTGSGVELTYNSSTGYVLSYNRTGSAWTALELRGLTVALAPSGTPTFTAAATVNTHTVPCQLKSYTVATLPATPAAGLTAYCSDAAVAPCAVFGNGSVWKRCDNAATTVV